MGKKTTLFMLLTAMLLCCFPLEAKAGQTSIDVSRLPNYNFTERTGQISGDGWSWDGTKRQLTLKGAVIYSTFDNVRLPDGTEIILQEGSDNYIVTQNGSYNNGLFSDGDITIKGTGRLYIDSGIGIQCAGQCRIEGADVSITAIYTGVSAHSFVQDSGKLSIRSKGSAIEGQTVTINGGRLFLDGLLSGISTKDMVINKGTVDISTISMGIQIFGGQLVINDGMLKIDTLNMGMHAFMGINLYQPEAQMIMHGGQAVITASGVAVFDSTYSTQMPAKPRLIMDGGEMRLTGQTAVEVESPASDVQKMTDKNFPQPSAIIQLSQGVQPAEQVQTGRVLETDQADDGQTVGWYVYGFVQDDQLASSVTLKAQ